MPRLQTNVPNQTQRVPEFPPVNTNNIFASSIQQQHHHPQLQVQPNYLNTFLSAQNDVGGGQQQRGPLFGTMGPVSPFIERTNYRSLLEFNSGNHHDYGFYHHTQNDQRLDLNTAFVTTNHEVTKV
ncbi:hypothetical protein KY289_019608 [Solanum tuberosum]|nr:hypothetical protein KY289_019608 [Solanum tuberosum]